MGGVGLCRELRVEVTVATTGHPRGREPDKEIRDEIGPVFLSGVGLSLSLSTSSCP